MSQEEVVRFAESLSEEFRGGLTKSGGKTVKDIISLDY